MADPIATTATDTTVATPAPTQPAAPNPDTPKNLLTGSANDDQSKKDKPADNQTPKISATPGQVVPGSVLDPKTGAAIKPDANSKIEPPGKREQNPLGDYPTYTYNITLYMISPEAYDKFINSGRKTIDTSLEGGTYIICQSGGINSTTQQRAAGFNLDYYIDNLQINTITSAKESETASNTTDVTFNIIEPYGFSFLSNLNRASDALKQRSEAAKKLKNASRQFFIIGIRFVGLNFDGKPLQTTDSTTGAVSQSISEKFYDIAITRIKFNLDNRMTTYAITAQTLSPNTAYGMKRGIWQTGGELTGTTVGEMLKNMCEQMNKQAKDLVKDRPEAKYNTYTFSYVGEGAGVGEENKTKGPIFSARMLSETQLGKLKLVTSNAKTTEQANEVKGGPPDPTKIKLTMNAGIPILQAFETIIVQSSYVEQAFKVLKTSADQAKAQNPAENQSKPQQTDAKIRWYNVSAECTKGVFDEVTQDWTWNINYVFRVYDTPMVDNAYSNLGIPYYGPHKRYNFLFGGKNSEIISYSQTLDNAFYNVVVGGADKDNASGSPVNQGQAADGARTGMNNQQKQETVAFATSLVDPGHLATATLKILGDPDFLVPDTTSSSSIVYNKFYGVDGYTVNPNGGQVFIEIDFKEAQDYDYATVDGSTYKPTNDGLMSLNDRIEFWRYNSDIASLVKGVSYMVGKVKSIFNSGKFEQDLTLYINTFPGYKPNVSRDLPEGKAGPSTRGPYRGTSPSNTQNNQTPGNTGLVAASPPTPDTTTTQPQPTSTDAGTQPVKPTATGQVADDDGLSEVSIASKKRVSQDAGGGRETGATFDGTNWYDAQGNVIPPRG
jgi:hypothetical protein